MALGEGGGEEEETNSRHATTFCLFYCFYPLILLFRFKYHLTLLDPSLLSFPLFFLYFFFYWASLCHRSFLQVSIPSSIQVNSHTFNRCIHCATTIT